MSKVIKASNINGKCEIKSYQSYLSSDNKKDKKANDDKKLEADQGRQISKNNIIKANVEAENKADKIIADAKIKAEEILQEAENKKTDIEERREEIYQQIKNEAEEEALASAQKTINEITENMHKTLENFNREIENEKKHLKGEVINLAVKIASLILNHKIEREPEIINNILADIFKNIDDGHKNINVKVHPKLIPYLEKSRFYDKLDDSEIEFSADTDLKPGDCIVRSNLGGKEAVLEHKLDLIREELLKEVEVNAGY